MAQARRPSRRSTVKPSAPPARRSGPSNTAPTGPTGAQSSQQPSQEETILTTAQGVRLPATDHSLKAGERGPTLMEDFHRREKITHFDHERIPERVVHARGAAAHGVVESYGTASNLTRAGFPQKGGAAPGLGPRQRRHGVGSPVKVAPDMHTGRSESSQVEIDQVGVVVPAHNEAQGLPRCLLGLAAAANAADVPVFVVVVLDSCTDDSAAVAAGVLAQVCLPAVCITSDAATVGGARRDGVRHLLQEMSWVGPARLWITTTDADSVVPPNWLHGHVRHARAGAEIVAGTVDVDDWSSWPAEVGDRYRSQYAVGLAGDGHGHIHGANLGIRADTYLQVGGFSPVPGDEDVDLIYRAQARGVAVTWALDVAVRTSARRIGRAPSGFARHLRVIAEQLDSNVRSATATPTDRTVVGPMALPDRWSCE